MARAEKRDPKAEALRAQRSLNPHPEAVTDAGFATSEFLDPRDLAQVKYEMVRRVRVEGDTVSATAPAFGFSRPSFYEAAAALDGAGLAGLVPARPTSSPTRSSSSPGRPRMRTRPCAHATWPRPSRNAST